MIDPLVILGLLSLGALAVLVAIGCVGAWLFRGHRVDLRGVKIVNTWEENDHRASFGPRRIIPKDFGTDPRQPAKEPDLYDLAHGRGEDDQR